MMETKEKAYAKINISLDVLGKRPDGYHDMYMVMQTISLCDELTVTLNGTGVCTAECSLPFVPGDERNLAVKAATAFFKAAGMERAGAHIVLEKRIPVGAGMAGGSADAAAVLRALNRLTDRRFDRRELEQIAAKVGSDVAFCVAGGTMLASGRGEILEDLPPLPDCCFAVCKPDFSISTPELFKKLDSVKLRCHPDSAGIIKGLENGSLKQIACRMYNVFEDVPDRRHNVIEEIKGKMLDKGAMGAIMTGTGSAVFGLYSDFHSAKATVEALGKEYRNSFLAENVRRLEV